MADGGRYEREVGRILFILLVK